MDTKIIPADVQEQMIKEQQNRLDALKSIKNRILQEIDGIQTFYPLRFQKGLLFDDFLIGKFRENKEQAVALEAFVLYYEEFYNKAKDIFGSDACERIPMDNTETKFKDILIK